MKPWPVAALVALGAVVLWQRQHYGTALADWRDSARGAVAVAGEREAQLARARAGIAAFGEVSAGAWGATARLKRVADSLRAVKRPLPPIVPAVCEVWAAEVSRCEAESDSLRLALDSAAVGRVADSSALALAQGQLQADSGTIRDLRGTLAKGVKVTGGCRVLGLLPCPEAYIEGATTLDGRRQRVAVGADVPLGSRAVVFGRVEADSGSRAWVGGRWYPFGRGR